MPFDNYGTAIIILKQGDVFTPGVDMEPAQVLQAAHTNLVATHAAISVPKTHQQIEQIGQREGWRVLTRPQGEGAFRVVELWLENRILVEFLPPEFQAQYLQTMQLEIVEQIFGQPVHPIAL